MDVKQPATLVPDEKINSVAGNNKPNLQLELAHDGDFKGFSKASLLMSAPANVSAGSYANLFYYNGGALTLESAGQVNSEGKADKSIF